MLIYVSAFNILLREQLVDQMTNLATNSDLYIKPNEGVQAIT